MASRRAARVAQRIKEEASQVMLYELRDPRIGLLTVTRVDISADLHYATIYYSIMGDDAARRTAQRGLESAKGLVRTRIAKSLQLREAPDIRFEFDPTIEKSIEMSKLIDAATTTDRSPEEDEDEAADD